MILGIYMAFLTVALVVAACLLFDLYLKNQNYVRQLIKCRAEYVKITMYLHELHKRHYISTKCQRCGHFFKQNKNDLVNRKLKYTHHQCPK